MQKLNPQNLRRAAEFNAMIEMRETISQARSVQNKKLTDLISAACPDAAAHFNDEYYEHDTKLVIFSAPGRLNICVTMPWPHGFNTNVDCYFCLDEFDKYLAARQARELAVKKQRELERSSADLLLNHPDNLMKKITVAGFKQWSA